MNKKLKILLMIAGTIILLYAIYRLILYIKNRKGTGGAVRDQFTPTSQAEAKKIVGQLANTDNPYLQYALKIHILETGNFSSNIFRQTNGAGMTAGGSGGYGIIKTMYPYGWTSLIPFWTANPDYKPIGVYKANEKWTYLIFKDLISSINTVKKVVENKTNSKGHAGYYYSNDNAQADDYLNKLDKIDLSNY